MTEEFNLSDKMVLDMDRHAFKFHDVKEAVKLSIEDMKEEGIASIEDFHSGLLQFSLNDIIQMFNKRFGDKLI